MKRIFFILLTLNISCGISEPKPEFKILPWQTLPSWSNTSNQIAFIQTKAPGTRLKIFDLDTNELRDLQTKRLLSQVSNPTWSWDDKFIALIAYPKIEIVDVTDQSNNFLIDVVSSNISWSPDSRYIVFDSFNEIYWSIKLYNLETKEITTLTDSSFDASYPSFSPDGEKILFSNKFNQIYMLNLISNSKTEIYREDLTNGYPYSYTDWSNQGDKIVFISNQVNRAPNTLINVFNLNDNVLKSIDPMLPAIRSPSFSPGGSQIVFSANNPATNDIEDFLYIMNTDGSGLKKLDIR